GRCRNRFSFAETNSRTAARPVLGFFDPFVAETAIDTPLSGNGMAGAINWSTVSCGAPQMKQRLKIT
ncbi:hypothetical protein, partial [Sphingomonas pruni]|uniref:hypothetical protein n=1 Tax=Sphingomonas pruni TaxID=40683 RepID=UPI001C3F87CB